MKKECENLNALNTQFLVGRWLCEGPWFVTKKECFPIPVTVIQGSDAALNTANRTMS
jgi:hypothetical protein